MKKNVLFLLLVSCMISSQLNVQSQCLPNWTPLTNQQYNMQIIGQILIEDELSTNSYDVVSAFVGSECRGIASPTAMNGIFFLTISSDTTSGEEIRLVVWRSDNCEQCETDITFQFQDQLLLGSIDEPYQVACGQNEIIIPLQTGYNWLSMNIQPENMNVNTVLYSLTPCQNNRIIGQTNFSVYYGTSWIGSLINIDPNRMYKIQLCSNQDLIIKGQAISNNPIQLGPGFTWLGYLPDQCLPLNTALSGLCPQPNDNDRIISQNAFAVYYNNSWIGSLTQLCPGRGYIIRLSQNHTLTYGVPNAPTFTAHVLTENQIQWNWNTVSNATGYKWHTTEDYASAIDLSNATTVTQTGLTCNTEYTIYVWAYNTFGNSSAATTTATTIGTAPAAPTSATHASAETQIQWNWNTTSGANGYKFNTVNDYFTATENGIITTYTQKELDCNTEYSLYVWAYNNCGNSTVLSLTSETQTCSVYGITCPDMPTYTDSRDGNVYPTIQISNQCWLAKNLAYLPSVVGPGTGSNTTPYYYVYGYNGTDVNAAKATSNYTTYGALYNWEAAMAGSESSNTNPSSVQGICPDGWYLPSDAEWTQLINYLGGDAAGGKMKSTGTTHWQSPNIGATNSSGFSGLPGGYRTHDYSFSYIGICGTWWSSTQYNTSEAFGRFIYYDSGNVYRGSNRKRASYSVRCLRYDNTCGAPPPKPTQDIHITSKTLIQWKWNSSAGADGYKYNTTDDYSTATDNGASTHYTQTELDCETQYTLYVWAYNVCGNSIVSVLSATTSDCSGDFSCGDHLIDSRDDNVYPTVQIGVQCWLAKNLAYLPLVHSNSQFQTQGNNSQPGYAVYGYDGSNVTDAKLEANYVMYGVLYNWWATMAGAGSSSSNPSGVQGICPAGWHLPSYAEWTQLTNYLGGESVAGGKMKSTGTTHWNSPNTGATNSCGFSGIPGGNRSEYGTFNSMGYYSYWWSSTEDDTVIAWCQSLHYFYSTAEKHYGVKKYGLSIRCIKD